MGRRLIAHGRIGKSGESAATLVAKESKHGQEGFSQNLPGEASPARLDTPRKFKIVEQNPISLWHVLGRIALTLVKSNPFVNGLVGVNGAHVRQPVA